VKKRIFIAINFSDKIKNKLAEYQQKIEQKFAYSCDSCPIKWTKKNNLHITLLFLGLVDDVEIPDLFKVVEKAISDIEIFDLNIEKLSYGPIGKENPKMVWANIEKNDALIELQNMIQRNIIDMGYNAEIDKKFTPHITIGRITQWQFRRIELEEVPEIEEPIGIGFSVQSIELMESFMNRGSSEYCVLKSISLKE
jgi:2'-5' RNA ligase